MIPAPAILPPEKPAIIRPAPERLWLPRRHQDAMRATSFFVPPPYIKPSANGNDSFTKLLLHCDGADTSTTFTDASVGGAHGNATVTGGAQVKTAQSKFGGASLYTGGSTNDRIGYANNSDWNLAGVDYTIDFWIYWSADPSDDFLIGAGNFGGTGWQFVLNSTTGFGIYDTGFKTLTWDPAATTWYHVALVGSGGTGSTHTIYVDGTSKGTITAPDMNNDSSGLTIGGYANNTYTINGYMDEVRISKGIARWTSNFTPPSGPYS